MKYRIIEEIDGTGVSVFYAQYTTINWRGKDVWNDVCVGGNTREKFNTAEEAKFFLMKFYAPKVVNILEEGTL